MSTYTPSVDFDDWWASVDSLDDRDERTIEDDDSFAWHSHWERFWCGSDGLDLCGCGSSDPQKAMARTLWALYESHLALEAQPQHEPYDPKDPRYPRGLMGEDWFSPITELCLHILAAKGFLDHGGSVNGGWLTPDGLAAASLVFGVQPEPKP